jgi:hypothetical protein
MQRHKSDNDHGSKLIAVLSLLLNSEVIGLVGTLWRFGVRLLRARVHEGMYEVLAYHARLELADTKGRKAVLHKQQRVRFRQDNIIAYQDKAWGDGEIFADYKCSPGVAVDRYREGHRYQILISLRATKNRGDEETFHIQRTIHEGFTQDVEDFQIEIDHTTRDFAFSVVFPQKRPPKQVTLIEQNAAHTRSLGPDHTHRLPDGRHQVTWRTPKARLFEAYILRWEW